MVGAVSAAIAASACCLVPAVLALLGVSGAGFAARFAPYRVHFLIATGVALAVGFYFAYRRQKDDCGCEAPRSRRRAARVGLWITTVLTVVLAAYPLLGNGNATAGSSEAAAKATVQLEVIGMDCKECTGTIAKAIKKVPGVVSVAVSYESGNAVVRHDGRDGVTEAAIKAVEDSGYRAKVRP
jgi:copper chaperone CopZ